MLKLTLKELYRSRESILPALQNRYIRQDFIKNLKSLFLGKEIDSAEYILESLQEKPYILIITPNNPLMNMAGVQKETYDTIRYLQTHNSNTTILLFYFNEISGLYSFQIITNSQYRTFSFTSTVLSSKLFSQLLSKKKPILCVVHHFAFHLTTIIRELEKSDFPKLLFIHDFHFLTHGKHIELSQLTLQQDDKKNTREIFKSMDYVIFNSEYTLAQYLEKLGISKRPENFLVSYPNINYSDFKS